ncbi:S41 family peptidase [Ekhidna sp.]|uniref:S41 family peptidase n=1 Tax=Ekhidna sp. TaxID=2608089 RepID=UPI003B5BBF78
MKRTILSIIVSGLFISSSFSQIQEITKAIETYYINQEVGSKLIKHLTTNEASYQNLSEEAFVIQVNKDLHAIHNDRHIQLISKKQSSSLPWSQQFIRTVKVLEGNIGYLEISHFPNPNDEVYGELASAFSLIEKTDGIIIDIRNNRGGHPETVSELLGYFTDGEVLYDRFYIPSESKAYDYETHKKVAGNKLIGKPLAILINEKTASVSELFALAVKNLKIGKVYGSNSMGLVNLAGYYPIGDSYYLLLSKGYQQNPFSEHGIENVGVKPDVESSSGLTNAHLDLVASVHGNELKDWIAEGLREKPLSSLDIQAFVGNYGSITIIESDGMLYYQDHTGFDYKMIPVSENTFQLESSMEVRFRIDFISDPNWMILSKRYFDGDMKVYQKN